MMRYFLSLLLIFSIKGFSQQTFTYIGELKPDFIKNKIDHELKIVPQQYFVKHWSFKAYIVEGNKKAQELPEPLVTPKESYYTGKGEQQGVEVRIKIPVSCFEYSTVTRTYKTIKVYLELINKKNEIEGFINPMEISVPSSKHDEYINSVTFKLKNKIPLASPEQVGLSITLSYLKDIIGDDAYGFQQTIYELERFKENKVNRYIIDNAQLKSFYQLQNFIEPYINENSFLNLEAKKLFNQIQVEKLTLPSKSRLEKTNQLFYTDFNAPAMDSLYQEYIIFYNKLKTYYDQIDLILFLKSSPFIEINNSNKKEMSAKNEKNVFFALGPSLQTLTTPIYDITLARGDSTVLFDSLSRYQPSFSAGLLFPIISNSLRNQDKESNYDSLNSTNGLVLGLFLHYFFPKSSYSAFSTQAIGLNVGLGYKNNNLGVLLTLGARSIREPRQYLIDRRNSHPPLGVTSIDIRDNSLFTNKLTTSIGFSVVYIFKSPLTGRLLK